MTSIFFYKKPSISIENQEKNKPSIFSYKKPEMQQEEIFSEKPKSFTQKVAQELTESEQLEKELERHHARSTSRAAERVAGTPGDIISLINSISGKEVLPSLPTSQKLKETSEKLSKGYTKAETPFEEKVDEYLGDLFSYALPGSKGGTLLKGNITKNLAGNYARLIGIPLAGALTKEGVSKVGGSEGKQTAAKLGSMLMLDLATKNIGGIRNYIGNLFEKSKAAIPKGAKADATNLVKSINDLEKKISLGGSAPHQDPALTKIKEIKDSILKNEIDAEKLPAFRKTINDVIDHLGGFSFETPQKTRKKMIHLLNDVKKSIISSGEEYGKKNPKFLKNWTEGNEAASVFSKSQFIKNTLERYLPNQLTGLASKLLFGLGGTGGAIAGKIAAPAAIGGLGLAGPIQAAKLLYRVIQSPTLRRYYANVLRGAAEANTPQIISNFKALDQKFKKEEEKEKSLIKKYTES